MMYNCVKPWGSCHFENFKCGQLVELCPTGNFACDLRILFFLVQRAAKTAAQVRVLIAPEISTDKLQKCWPKFRPNLGLDYADAGTQGTCNINTLPKVKYTLRIRDIHGVYEHRLSIRIG